MSWLGRPLIALEEIGSTNDEVARLARGGAAAGLVVVADRQTGGRGRRGRSWSSPTGVGLYFSLLLRPGCMPLEAHGAVFAASVGLHQAVVGLLEEASPGTAGTVGIKWPNDLHAGRRKLAGLLAELAVQGQTATQVVVGIGVNVGRREWPPELAPIAVSLEELAGVPLERDRVLARVLESLEPWFDRWQSGELAEVMAAWRQRALGLGQPVKVQTGDAELRGVAEEVDDSGTLWLRSDSGERLRITTGDVSLVAACDPDLPAR